MANGYPLSYVSENLSKMMAEFVTDYEKEISGKAQEVTRQVAEDFASQLKEVTPKSEHAGFHGHLADTIVISEKGEKFAGGKNKALYVHFEKWQIAHLLEFGWTARNGMFITRTPFIRPLFDKNMPKYYNMYKEALSK